MKQSNIRHAVKEFEKEFGYLTPIDPQLIGFSWTIGRQGDNVVLARAYPRMDNLFFEFSLMSNKNYEHWWLNNEDRKNEEQETENG